jgi:CRISPR-associated endonuclease/helicase Cas3
VPVLEVLLPLDEAALPNWKPWERIYDAFILWRTWEVLREEMHANEREIVLPRDYRALIEAVYQEQPSVEAGTPYSGAMAKALTQLELTRGDMETHARYQLTPPATSTDAIVEVADRQFTEDEDGTLAGWQVAKTRLGDSITVIPLYRIAGELCLDSGGTHRLSADIPPHTANELKAVLERSIPISDRRLIAAFRAGELTDMLWPWPERQVPRLLRSRFPLLLDEQHTAVIAGRTLRLDPELGLVIA